MHNTACGSKKRKKKEEIITKPVKVKDLKISDPSWDLCTTFPS